MEVKYKKQYLAELYCGKKVKDKKFKSAPKLVKQYQKTVSKLINVTRIEQLYQFKSLNYEKLSGNLKGKSSVRINEQYRLIFTEIPANEPPYQIEIIELEEISKHYEN